MVCTRKENERDFEANTHERIEAALACIDPNCDYYTWMRVGMALHAHYPTKRGLEIYDRWSAQGEGYKAKEVRAKWRSFKSGGGVSIATLFHIAKEYGYSERNSTLWPRYQYQATSTPPVFDNDAQTSNAEPDYPPQDEVFDLWESCQTVTSRRYAKDWLASRNLSPEGVEKADVARVISDKTPAWARYGKRSWWETGHRLVVPLYDHRGEMRSMQARLILEMSESFPKGLSPKGYSVSGLIMADSHALAVLGEEDNPITLAISEGVPDFLSMATKAYKWQENQKCNVSVMSGSWNDAHAARVPDRSIVFIYTDPDPAGEKYAKNIQWSFNGRCETFRE